MAKPFIAVVGGVNVDIAGTSGASMLLGDSNPGHVKINMGGVGRNIAEDMARLGAEITMVTALGDDANLAAIRESCGRIGIDLSHAEVFHNRSNGTYLCLNNSDGELYAAVSDMSICEMITPAFLAERLPVLNRAALVFVDANIPADSVAYLAENCTALMMADPVSVRKSVRLRDHLGAFTAMKPNRPEAQALTGVEINGPADLEKAARALHEKGLKKVFISLGAGGVYFSEGGEHGVQPCLPADIINTNGCGDAFIAAVALGCTEGLSVRELALMGQAASAINA